MATMIPQTIQDLAKDLAQRRMVNDPPPVLLLGAGASAAAGVTLMKHLVPAFDCTSTEEFFQEIQPARGSDSGNCSSIFRRTGAIRAEAPVASQA